MDRLIQKYKWTSIVIYIDDLVVFSRTWEDHLEKIDWVLTEIGKIGLTLDPAKAYVGFKSIELLGHVVNKFGLATQEKKIKAMMDLPIPKSLHDVRSFLGFFGYYRQFIENYAQIIDPIASLLEQLGPKNITKRDRKAAVSKEAYKRINVSGVWNKTHDIAFKRIKEALKNATILSHAFLNADFTYILYDDASKKNMEERYMP